MDSKAQCRMMIKNVTYIKEITQMFMLFKKDLHTIEQKYHKECSRERKTRMLPNRPLKENGLKKDRVKTMLLSQSLSGIIGQQKA